MCLLVFLLRVEFIQLAQEQQPLNLGQGFPDYGCPKHVTEGLAELARDPNLLLHQYSRGYVSTDRERAGTPDSCVAMNTECRGMLMF